MLAGEQVVAVSLPGTLYLVPMTDGGAKALPKSIRHSTSGGGTKRRDPNEMNRGGEGAAEFSSNSNNMSHSAASDFFSLESVKRRSVIPVQVVSSNFRLSISPYVTADAASVAAKPIQLPYMLIDRFEVDIRERDHVFALTITSKWTWVVRIQSLSEDPIQTLANFLERGFPRMIHQFFAFSHFSALREKPCVRMQAFEDDVTTTTTSVMRISPTQESYGIMDGGGVFDTCWGAFHLERELHRQTVLNGQRYRHRHHVHPQQHSLNTLPDAGDPALVHFGLSKNILPWFHVVPLTRHDIFFSYPAAVVLPKRVTVELAERCASYRQLGRIPAVSWIHGVNGATLSRSSQPKSGTRRQTAKDDQALCSHLNQSYHPTNAITRQAAEANAGTAVSHGASPPPPLQLAPAVRATPPPSLFESDASAKPPPPPAAACPPALYERSSSSSSSSVFDEPVCGTELASDVDDEVTVEQVLPSKTTPAKIINPHSSVPANNTPNHTANSSVLANKSEQRTLHIIDCRSRTAATANMATGGGYELVSNYTQTTLEFMGLDNIHVVRDSFDRLRKLCVAMQQPSIECPSSRSAQGAFHGRLEATEWVLLQERLLWSSWKVATLLHNGTSVLVHCTDGWDRTAQVVSLAKVQLDAHYRTTEGFCELIMWEWLHMGHKFADRCGLERPGDNDEYICLDSDGEEESQDDEDEQRGATEAVIPSSYSTSNGINASSVTSNMTKAGATTDGDAASSLVATLFTSSSATAQSRSNNNKSHSPSSQIAPIFLQFMDCVYQMWHMFPNEFEFTPALLHYILEAVYSCRFGTFLHNCHRLRMKKNGLFTKTASLWSAIESMITVERSEPASIPHDERFINPFYRPSRCHRGSDIALVNKTFAAQRIIPSYQAFRYRFWASLYCRFHWEGTGCPTESDSISPLYDAVLVLAQRANVRQLSDVDGWCEVGGDVASRQDSHEQYGDAEEDSNVHTGGRGEAYRFLFPHRVPLTHLTTEWQIVRSNKTRGVGGGGGAAHDGLSSGATQGNEVQLLLGHGAHRDVVASGGFIARTDADACQLCHAVFTLFFRRHTCRRCCRSACGNCSNHFMVMPRNSIALYEERDATHPVRLCTECYLDMKRLMSGPLHQAGMMMSSSGR